MTTVWQYVLALATDPRHKSLRTETEELHENKNEAIRYIGEVIGQKKCNLLQSDGVVMTLTRMTTANRSAIPCLRGSNTSGRGDSQTPGLTCWNSPHPHRQSSAFPIFTQKEWYPIQERRLIGDDGV